MTIRILLADDQALVRSALAALLELEDDFEVVAQVGRGDEVVAAARAAQPDVALLDIEMPGLDGLAAAAALTHEVATCRVIIVTTFGRPGYLRRAMESGALGFVVKDAPAEQLADAIRRVSAACGWWIRRWPRRRSPAACHQVDEFSGGAGAARLLLSSGERAWAADPMWEMAGKRGAGDESPRREVVADAHWYESPHVKELRRKAGMDDCIYSLFRCREQSWAMGLEVHRAWGAKNFGNGSGVGARGA